MYDHHNHSNSVYDIIMMYMIILVTIVGIPRKTAKQWTAPTASARPATSSSTASSQPRAWRRRCTRNKCSRTACGCSRRRAFRHSMWRIMTPLNYSISALLVSYNELSIILYVYIISCFFINIYIIIINIYYCYYIYIIHI